MFRTFALPSAVLCLGASFAQAQTHFPPPPTPAANPTTAEKALLGKALFWDEQLSSSRTVACGTCHRHDHGGCDPRAPGARHPGPDGIRDTEDDVRGSLGIVRQDHSGRYVGDAVFGVRPQVSGRRALPVVNAAYGTRLMWDGRVGDDFIDPDADEVLIRGGAALEQQATRSPIDATKMAHLGRTWQEIAEDLAGLRPLALAFDLPPDLHEQAPTLTYAEWFEQVFKTPGVTGARVAMAIAAYERTLVSDLSPYDLHLAGKQPLEGAALAGLAVFERRCMECHDDLKALDQPAPTSFRRTGVRPAHEDPGLFGATGNPSDMGKFKVPALRNVALRTPYMHNGGLLTLEAVIDFYNRGGDHGDGIDPLMREIAGQLTVQDRADLVAFLHSLTDPRVERGLPPFDRPRLWSEGPNTPYRLGAPTVGESAMRPEALAYSPPYRGNAHFAVAADGIAPGIPHFLLLDFARIDEPTMLLGHPSYLRRSSLRYYGCGRTQATDGGEGFASLVLEVPRDPFLVGLQVFGQWFFADRAGVQGLVSSATFAAVVF